MAIDALVKPLLRLPLFQGLKPLQLTEIVRRADRMLYKPGDVLIEEDLPADCAIIIVSGEAARIDSESEGVPAEIVSEGSMVAELAMLVETAHSATIVARTPIKALKISREEMHELMAEDMALAEHMVERIALRLKTLAAEVRAIDEMLAVETRDIAMLATAKMPNAPAAFSLH